MHEQFSPDPVTSADWERLRPVIDETLGELPERDREAVLLRFFAGLPLADVGEKLNLTENAARMRVERALGKLHAILVRRGVKSSAGALAIVLTQQVAMGAPAGMAASVTATALTTAAGNSLGTLIAGFFMKTKSSLIAVGIAGVLGVGIYFASDARFEAKIAVETAAQQQQLARLRAENRQMQARIQRMVAGLNPAIGGSFAPPVDPIARLRALTDLIVDGTIGADAIRWVSFAGEADLFGLRPDDEVSARRSQALVEMFALTPNEVATLRELGDRAKAEIARGAIANSVVRRDGDRLTIEVRPAPTARDTYQRMLAEFQQTLGKDRFGLARMIGWETSIENQMNFIGLSAFTFASAREAAADRPDGVIYRGRRRDASGKGRSYVSGSTDLRTGLGPLGVLVPADF